MKLVARSEFVKGERESEETKGYEIYICVWKEKYKERNNKKKTVLEKDEGTYDRKGMKGRIMRR